jgi:transcriptional regulator with PAS, ATPase and Fis domain
MPAPDSFSSGLADAYDTKTGSSDGRALHVLICEEQSLRLQLISRLVVEGGAEPLHVKDSTDLTKLPSLHCFIALIGFAACHAANSPALNTVRALVNSGLFVMCYADHVRTWPLSKRCNVLLAGALTLFDSAEPEFPQELKKALAEVLRLQSGKRNEEARIKTEIKALGMIGESRVMQSIFLWVKRASALSDLPALITGETGTGKELLVNAIHRLDRKRSKGPLIALNCGAITAGVAESELFGHRRGAFTGAERDRPGLVRAANGGILFLDEIGDLDVALQSKLLRVLQENRVLAVGEDRELPVNVRVIAATNRNLREMVERGAFRDDLFHRLNILSVHIPALRQRPADLKPLVRHFVKKHRNLSSGMRVSVDPEFIEALAQLDLPGNAREVENLVRRALVNKTMNSPLGLSDLPPEVLEKLAEQQVKPPFSNNGPGTEDQPDRLPYLQGGADYDVSLFKLLQLNKGSLAQTLQQCERVLIACALEHSHGNQSSVAKLLGITSRSVYNKIRKYDLH